ncbi:MAG TPA: phosphopyruvate hydratase [Thermoplasmatales archaeon]|nr:phosphopyruvate hydratase [Thermoplasmatales archaeon]
MKFKIDYISARQILDSRGNPTIEVEVRAGDSRGIASAPSGASKGKMEALELRDGGEEFHGKGVKKAIKNVERIIAPAIKGMDVREQEKIDKKMIEIDATKNKSVLGANACIAVSIAVCKCASCCLKKEVYEYLNEEARILPVPFMNVINGGVHAGNELAIQEHMIVPVGAKNFTHAIQMGSEIYHTLKEKIRDKFGKSAINVGDEGGFAPPLNKTEDALNIILDAIEENGYTKEVKIALDCAASSFYKNDRYFLNGEMTGRELLEYYIELVKSYPIISIEDAFHEEDWDAFIEITEKLGGKIQIVGDDIFVTNAKRLKKGIKSKACNALLLKPNQIGTLTEAIEVAKICYENKYDVMVSHRSGDTCDDFIADLAVALQTGQIKSGAPARGERISKYNRLLKIEDKLEKPLYAGKKMKN